MCRHNSDSLVPYRIQWSTESTVVFASLPLIEHFQKDDVDTMVCRVLGFRGWKACRCRKEKNPGWRKTCFLPQLSLAAGQPGPTTTDIAREARHHSSCNRDSLYVLIILVFSIIKNNKNLLPGEHLITQRKSYAWTSVSLFPEKSKAKKSFA